MTVARRETFGEKLGFAAFRGYTALVQSLSLDRASDLGAAIGRTFGPLSPTDQVARRNMRLAFPGMSRAEEDRLIRAMWDNLGRLAGEFPHLGSIEPFSGDDRISFERLDLLDAWRDGGRPVVFVSGHFANWELMPMTIARRGVVCQMTYRPANNPYVDDWIVAERARYGTRLFAPKGAAGGRELLKALGRGEAVAIMNDQKYNTGLAVPLFGHDAMTADAPTRLALQFDAILAPMSVVRTGGARFRVICHDPIDFDRSLPKEEAVRAGVIAINRFIEDRIRAHPDQWFWVHRRWPKDAWAKAGV
jgi:Kdo2-lipid IVA lauroyltransferase/acyltransferase